MRTAALLALLLAACGETATPGADAGADAGGSDLPVSIPWLLEGAPPVAPPVLTPCPAGWREVSDPVLPTTCDPTPEGGTPACAADELFVPGAAACAPIGSVCPADGLPAELPTDRTIRYVLAGAAAGGDGSRDRPFARISDALAGATRGLIVAIGRGTYDEPVSVPANVALWGACVEETVIVASAALDRTAVLTVGGTGVEIRNLRIGASPRWGLAMPPAGRSAVVEDVVIEGSLGLGITIAGGRLDARRLVVRGVRLASGRLGYGIDVELGGTAHLESSVFDGTGAAGLFAAGDGSRIEAIDVIVRGGGEQGAAGQRMAELDLERVLIEGRGDLGIAGIASAIAARDVVIRDIAADASGRFGRGVQVQASTADLSRVLIERVTEIGLVASQEGAVATLADVVIRDVTHAADGTMGRGLHVQTGGRIEGTRVAIGHVFDAGAMAAVSGTAVLTDLHVHDVRAFGGLAGGGRGLQAQEGGVLEVRRAIVEETSEMSVGCQTAGSSLLLEDALVRRSRPRPEDGRGGYGVSVGLGASGTLRRVVVEESREYGIVVVGAPPDTTTSITLEDVLVRASRAAECGAGCPDTPGGHGLTVAYAGVTATRFAAVDADLCALFLIAPTRTALGSGLVSRASVGVCVQEAPGIDPASIGDAVRFVDNATAFQISDLPAPMPPSALQMLAE